MLGIWCLHLGPFYTIGGEGHQSRILGEFWNMIGKSLTLSQSYFRIPLEFLTGGLFHQ
jgi:hypothetical protein